MASSKGKGGRPSLSPKGGPSPTIKATLRPVHVDLIVLWDHRYTRTGISAGLRGLLDAVLADAEFLERHGFVTREAAE